MSKIIKLNNLKSLRSKFKNKKIILAHGVFDILHIGHIEYFKEAKNLGDILIVSVTANRFVNKGVNRPYFDEKLRISLLTELSVIDFVILSPEVSAITIIKKLKPDHYVKGPDYKISENDKAGNLNRERKEVEKHGGQLKFTNGRLFSSTKVLNSNFDEFKVLEKIRKMNSLKKINNGKILRSFEKAIKKIFKEKILVIGETILDNYFYSESLGTPSKENILSVNYLKKEEYIGGALPVALNVSEISKNVTFATFYKDSAIIKEIEKKDNKKIKYKFFLEKNYQEIKKNRFIDFHTKKKFFEFYEFSNIEFYNKQLEQFLIKNLCKFDKIIVCDFGHGMFNREVINIIQKYSKFLCLNVQTNSGNRGYNLFKKFTKADLLVLDEPEARLGLSDRYGSLDDLIISKDLKKFKNLIVTRGIKGLICRDWKAKNGFLSFPAFNTKVIDTLGAGDAAYAYASMFINNCDGNKILIGLLSSIAGALKTEIIGHKKFLQFSEVSISLESILKE
jgi:rfaE bifunctional protein nucleotidyltransferase chain/domain